jgi:TolB-like protein/Tfp pilus assembly protein PilF
MESIILKALDKDPDRRYQSAREMRVDLERLSAYVSVDVPKQKPIRTGLWLWAIGGVAALLAALVLLNVGGLMDRLVGRSSPGPIESLAVLPLKNLSGDPEQEFFADGMTDELIINLSKIGDLDVISRTSVMRYKGSDKPLPHIARELGVDAVVEGSVLRSEGEVRITVQLIHGGTDRHLWAESYQRPLRDVLKLQGEVARAVAHEIDVALTPQEERRLARALPVDPEVHEAYLKGIYHFMSFTGDGLMKSIEYLESSISRDPDYAPAYATLAAVHLNSTYFMSLPPTETVPAAMDAMEKALELDPENEEALLSQAWIEMTYEWDWAGAERSHRRALGLSPGRAFAHHNYAYMLACLGRFDEAVSHGRRAEQLDPLSPNIGQTVGMVLYFARRYDEAIAQLERTIELEPTFWLTYQRLALVLLARGEYARGLEVIERAMSLAGPSTLRNGRPLYAQLLAASGRREEAAAIRKELEEIERRHYLPPCDIARVHVGLGNTDEAFRWLEKAIEVKDGDLFMFKAWPVWDPLRSDPRCKDLLRRMNFPKS